MPRLWVPYTRDSKTKAIDLMTLKCGFCRSTNMNTDSLTCNSCGTTAPNTTFKKKAGKKKDAV